MREILNSYRQQICLSGLPVHLGEITPRYLVPRPKGSELFNSF